MTGLNKIMLIGTAGRNPDTRYIGQGASFSRFSVATSCPATGPGGRQMVETEWHECVAFGSLSGYVDRYLKKGDTVYVEGKLKSRYVSDGPESGHRIYEVHASAVSIIARSKANEQVPKPDESAGSEPRIGAAIPGFNIDNIPGALNADPAGEPF